MRKLIAIVAAPGAIALVVLLGGCGGSAGPSELPHEAPASEIGPITGSVFGARAAANRDAARRLAAAPLPPGSHRIPHLPPGYGLNSPEFAPVTPNLIRKEALFLTKLDPTEAFAWLKAHPPAKAGAQRLLTSGGEGEYTSQTVGFQWGDSRAADGRQQYDTVVNRPAGGAAIRIETQAVWIRPRLKGERVPTGARLLELKLVHRERREATAQVRDPAEVAEFAALIDRAEVLQPGGPESCEELGEYPHHLVLTFRAAPDGPVLAVAEQELPVGNCQLLGLTVEGKKLRPLEPSNALIGRVLKRLGMKAGAGG